MRHKEAEWVLMMSEWWSLKVSAIQRVPTFVERTEPLLEEASFEEQGIRAGMPRKEEEEMAFA